MFYGQETKKKLTQKIKYVLFFVLYLFFQLFLTANFSKSTMDLRADLPDISLTTVRDGVVAKKTNDQ